MPCNHNHKGEIEFLSNMKKELLEFVEKKIKEEDGIESMEYTCSILYNLIINTIYFSSNEDLPEAYPSNLLFFLDGLTHFMVKANIQSLMEDKEETTEICDHEQ